MEFLDARRLTGPSLLADAPGTILDVACGLTEAERLLPVWKTHVGRMLHDLGWNESEFSSIRFTGGISLFFTAPIDALYAATEINEWAWAASEAELAGAEPPDYAAALAAIRESISEEANPALLELRAAAEDHATSFLWDDDEVSLGLGRHSRTWPVRDLPRPEAVSWSGHADVPVGIVTGTNGKTTTVRITTHILQAARMHVGLSSTDWIAVNERIIDRGDWSGPGGARAVLRQPDVDVAILEAARGGLLRRGLGVDKADAALITNIAEDHLGDFGSQNLVELMNIKWIVSRAVAAEGVLVLNADDELLVAKAQSYPGEIIWFSLEPENPVITGHIAAGGEAFVREDAELLQLRGQTREMICRVSDVAITLNGAAEHNVANALAACALSKSLGAAMAEIRAGLTSMTQDDNPGRCNVYEKNGCTVLVDFAHNPHAMKALFEMARALPAKRRVLCFGQAGDRPDAAIRELARHAWAIGLDKVHVSELATYHRGREEGEVFDLICDELQGQGARPEQIEHFDEEIDALVSALEWARPGDLVIMLALASATEIKSHLQAR